QAGELGDDRLPLRLEVAAVRLVAYGRGQPVEAADQVGRGGDEPVAGLLVEPAPPRVEPERQRGVLAGRLELEQPAQGSAVAGGRGGGERADAVRVGGVAAEQAERGRRPRGRAVRVLPLQYGEPPAQ